MSEQAVIGILFTVLFALVGALFRANNRRFDNIEDKLSSNEFAEHQGMDREREKQWSRWRDQLDAWCRQIETRLRRMEERARRRDGGT